MNEVLKDDYFRFSFIKGKVNRITWNFSKSEKIKIIRF